MRLIDADALIRQIESPYTEYTVMIQIRRALKEFINSAPSIDIVRCKECKFYTEVKGCLLEDISTRQADDFCSYGEREGE